MCRLVKFHMIENATYIQIHMSKSLVFITLNSTASLNYRAEIPIQRRRLFFSNLISGPRTININKERIKT